MKSEQEFLGLLQETLKEARRKGYRISRGEIEDIFTSFSLEEGQLSQVEDYLKCTRNRRGSS